MCVTKKPSFFARLGFNETPATWVRASRTLAQHPTDQARVGMVARPNAPAPEAR